MLITPAFAQSNCRLRLGGDSGGMITSLLPLILIVVIMYFLVLRPQQQRVKQHQAMVKALRRGDTVVTNGGLVGKVTKVVDDDQIEVEISDGVRVRQMRSMVSEVRAKGEPVKDESGPRILGQHGAIATRTIVSMLFFTRWKAAGILLTALVVCLFALPNFFSESTVREMAVMGAAPHRARPRPAGRIEPAA